MEEVQKATGLSKYLGLMFKNNPKPMFFELKKEGVYAIHSLFVKGEFLAIYLDEDNEVVDVKKVKPWKTNIRPKKKFKRLIEVPL